jgi:hypothetical protein
LGYSERRQRLPRFQDLDAREKPAMAGAGKRGDMDDEIPF